MKNLFLFSIAAVGTLLIYNSWKAMNAPVKKTEDKKPDDAGAVLIKEDTNTSMLRRYDASPRETLPTPARLLVGSKWPDMASVDQSLVRG